MENENTQQTKGKVCKIQGCKRPYKAKGYCNVHYQRWRKGDLTKTRYKTCHFGVNKLHRNEKKECLKPVFSRGLCEEHFNAEFGKKQADNPASAEA